MSFAEFPEAFIWTCDECGYEVWFKPRNFFACVEELKARRWGFSPPQGDEDWGHTCGRCCHKHRQTSIMNQTIKSVRG